MGCGFLPEGVSGVHRAGAAARKVCKGCRRECRDAAASVVPVGPSRADPLLAEAPRASRGRGVRRSRGLVTAGS
jgi:hypothetical protein